jgi:integrase
MKHDAWRQDALGEKPKMTWHDLTTEWLLEKGANGKRSLDDDKDKLRWLNPHFNNGLMLLEDIDSTFIADVLKAKRAEGNIKTLNDGEKRVKPLANATINRYAALIHSMMALAHGKGWISTVPPVQKLKEIKERVSYLTPEQAVALLRELPEHLSVMARFALATGLRQDNVVQLQWANVDIDRKVAWAWSDEMKGKADHSIPLNQDALDVLKAQLEKRKNKCLYVFADGEGRPYGYPAGRSWKSALKRTGIPEGFRWHDLRHTWATWHIMNETPVEVLMKLGGWKSLAMVLKYAHLGQSHLASHASNISLPPITREASDTFTSQQIAC